MGRRERSKPTTLSEEYVADSADEQNVAQSDRARASRAKGALETTFKPRSPAKAQEHRKRKTAGSASEPSSGSQSGEEDDHEFEEEAEEEDEEDGDGHQDEEDEEGDEDEPEVADLIDESSKHASSKSSSGKERPRKKSKIISVTERSIPPKPFDPPPGFVRRVAVDTDSTSHVYQFLNDELMGKQVWQFTAPASVSLDSIKTFGIHAARNGETVLKTDGRSYRFAEEQATSTCLLIPSEGKAEYIPGKPTILRTYHLREIVNPPTKGKETEANQSRPMFFEFQPDDELPARSKREQPEGLRMRYKPFGTTEEGSSDERSEFYIPAEISIPSEDHSQQKSKKSHRHREPPAARVDSDALGMESSQNLPSSRTVSPQSTRHLQGSPSKREVLEKDSAGQEKTRKKSKRRRDRVTSSD